MSEATNNTGWPFGDAGDGAGFGDIEKIFNSGSSTPTGDVNPFDTPQEQQTAQPAPAAVGTMETGATPAEPAAEEKTTGASTPSANETPRQPSVQETPPAAQPTSAEAPAVENPLAAAFNQKTVENAQKGLFEKPPVFYHKGAKEEEQFFAYVPKQRVSKSFIDADLTDCPYDDEERYIRYADIHSHNSMKAFFSGTDDRVPEKLPRTRAEARHPQKLYQ